MKRLLKAIALLLVMALLSVVFSLQTIVSSGPFKNQLVKTLTANLPGELQLGTLTLDFATGLQVNDIQWQQQAVPILQLKQMVLDIDWLDLLHGQLTIRKIHFTQGEVVASQADLLTWTPPDKPISSHPKPPPFVGLTASTLPIQLDMQSLVLEGINLNFALNATQHLSMRNVALHAAFRMNNQGVDLKGTLTIDALTFADGQNSRSQPLTLDFNLQGDLEHQGLRSTQSGIRLGELIHIPLDIQIKTDQHPAEILLAISTDKMALPPILALVEPWLPPEFKPATLQGQLQPIFSLTGQWREDGFHGLASGEIVLTDFMADLPTLEAKMAASLVRLTLTKLKINANALQELSTELSLASAKSTFSKQQFHKLSILAVADYQPDGNLNGHMRIKAREIIPWLPDKNPPTFPFETMLLAHGNLAEQSVSLSQFILKAGDIVQITGQGKTSKTPQGFDIQAKLQSELDGTHLSQLLPQHLLDEISLKIKPGKSHFTLQGNTSLGGDWMPQHLKAQGTATLMPLVAQLKESDSQADIQALDLSWQASQPLLGGAVDGKLQANARLGAVTLDKTTSLASGSLTLDATGQFLPQKRSWSNEITLKTKLDSILNHLPQLAMDQLQTSFKATIAGRLTDENEWQPMTMEEELSGQATALLLTQGTTQIKLLKLTFDGRGTSDLLQNTHQLQQGKLHADQLLTANITGHYLAQTDHYELTGSFDHLDLAQIGDKVQINAIPWLTEAKATGQMDLQFTGSGALAAWSKWDGHTLPLLAEIKITGQNLSGQWETNQIKGGKGKILLSLRPEKNQHINLTANLQANQVQLAEESSPKEINNINVDLELLGTGFNQFTIQRAQTTWPGLEARAQGKIFGASHLLSQQGTTLEQLKPLFMDLGIQVNLDLAKESLFLPALGLQGQGQNALDIKLSKPINGPITLNTTAGLHAVALQQPGFALNQATGQFTGVKTLWLSKESMPVKAQIRRAFSLDRILTPPSWADATKRLRIASIKLGDIEAKEVGITLHFQENAFQGQNLEMRLLGGTIGGNLLLEGVKPSHLDGVLEGVGIDLNQLLSASDQIAGEGSVDFVSRYALRFDKQSGKLNWGRTNINLIFTRIGKEALNRLLLFLDPKESNPAIVNARSKVSYANPASLDLQLNQGTIKLTIHFREGLISTLKIDRIPLGILGRFDQIQQHLLPLENFARLLETMGLAYLDLKNHETTPAP